MQPETPPKPHLQPRIISIQNNATGPGCLVQSLWFIFVGWWLGGIILAVAWFLNITIIGLPLGMMLLNNVPKILALQEPKTQTRTISASGQIVMQTVESNQVNFLLRATFFILIGWWWSGIWLSIAYFFCATIILMPLGLEMFRTTPAMTTLRKY